MRETKPRSDSDFFIAAIPAFARLILLLAVLTPSNAFANQCIHLSDAEQSKLYREEYVKADIIFLGKVTRNEWYVDPEGFERGEATFEISRVWRGDIGNRISIDNVWGCLNFFDIGAEYIVFVSKVTDAKWAYRIRSGFIVYPNTRGLTRDFHPEYPEARRSYLACIVQRLGEGSPPRRQSPVEWAKANARLSMFAGSGLLAFVIILFLFAWRLRRAS